MNTDTTGKCLAIEVEGATAILTIERASRRNAMNEALIAELKAALVRFDRDASIKAIVLGGVAPGFCAGSDLKYISGLSLEQMCQFEQETGDATRLIGFISKPVIAAVEGFAMGGGFILAASCDIVVAARSSQWRLPEVPIGWITPWGIKALIARAGFVKARHLCLGLDVLKGDEVRDLGIADYVADDGKVLELAMEYAERIAELPMPAVASTKRFFSNYIMSDAESMDYEANRLFADNCRQRDAQKTLQKYADKVTA